MHPIRVEEDPFDIATEIALAMGGDTGIGGVAVFIGTVRDTADGTPVTSLTLEHYPGMTERELIRIADEARSRWPLSAVRIVHRAGRMVPGDPIVLVVCTSAHRQAAFDACAFIMDFLKTQAPFWKQEETPDGVAWVAAKSTDDDAAARWGGDAPIPP